MKGRLSALPVFTILFLMGSVGACGAEGGAGGPRAPMKLTLAEAVSRALESSEKIKAAEASLTAARAAVSEARAGGLPNVSADAAFSRTKRELTESDKAFKALAESFGGGSGLVPERYENLYSAGVTLSQPLFTGGAITGGVRSARALSRAAAEGVRFSRLMTIATAVRTYYAAALAGEVREVRSATYDLARKHYEDVARRRKAGAASAFDVLRAKVAMQNQEAERISSEGLALRARVALLREIGMPQDSPITLVTPVDKPGEVPDLGRSLEVARRRRSEIRQADHSVRAGEHNLRAARAGYYPTLSATARWGGEAYDDPFAGENFNEYGSLGLEFRWSLFDGLLTRSRVAGARAELTRLRWERRGLERDAEAEVRSAIAAIESARRFVRAQGANVGEATEALRLAEVSHRAGTATELDVQDARDQLERARLNYVRSLFEHAASMLDYYSATGALDSVDWSSGATIPGDDAAGAAAPAASRR